MQPWLRRVLSVVGVILFGGALIQYVAMPRGMGTGCDVYRVRGRVLDDATGSPIAGAWVTVGSEAADAGSMQAHAPPGIDTARSSPDGTFELEILVWYCHGQGGLFSRGDEARDPPRYRSLWVVTSEGLVAAAELPEAGWEPASPVPKELGEPEATLVLGDIRLPARR